MKRLSIASRWILLALGTALALACAVKAPPPSPPQASFRNPPPKPVEAAVANPPQLPAEAENSDRRDLYYQGPVHTALWEVAKFGMHGGARVEENKTWVRQHIFDIRGRLLEENNNATRQTRSYDERGLVIKQQDFRAALLESTSLYSYDESGRVSLVEVNDAKGALRDRTAYTYDGGGRLAGKVTSKPGGTVEDHWVFLYDDKGQLTEEARYSVTLAAGQAPPQRTLEQKLRYEYDSAGRRVKETLLSSLDSPALMTELQLSPAGGVLEKSQTQYDRTGRAAYNLQESYQMDGVPSRTEEVEFGLSGNALYGSVTTYAYEFDAHGNWTKQVMYYKDNKGTGQGAEPVPMQTTYRKISYYTTGG